MLRQRPPSPDLAPFVASLWHGESGGKANLEHVLPSGAMHIVLRLSGPPVRLIEQHAAGYALIGDSCSAYLTPRCSWLQLAPHYHLAIAAGYSDQAHFCREVHSFAGVTPAQVKFLQYQRPAIALHWISCPTAFTNCSPT